MNLHQLRRICPGIDPMQISYALAMALLNPEDHADQNLIGRRLWKQNREIQRSRGQ
ncbi:MAG TPA: hypothetical protein VMG59_06385 [Phycisphaerae bacterium]|nr:hypothetical protein [Phycisphaerae bacterium]